MSLAPSSRIHWHVAEKPVLLKQKLRVKGREPAAHSRGNEGPNKPWQSSLCWVRLCSAATVSIFGLPEFCRRTLANRYTQWQVQDEPAPPPWSGELGRGLKPLAGPGKQKSGSCSPSRQHQNRLKELESSTTRGRNLFPCICCSSVALSCGEHSELMSTSRLDSSSIFALFCH